MKKTITGLVVCLSLLTIPCNSFAFSECVREVKSVFSSLSGSTSVWVCFITETPGNCIYKDESQLTDGQMARFLSMALTAKTTGKRLQVRYPEDDLVCPPAGSSRNDFLGMWLVD